jgi:hypothetical protein
VTGDYLAGRRDRLGAESSPPRRVIRPYCEVAGLLDRPRPGWPRERGARKLSLRVLSANDAARRLHERLGSCREATLRGELLINGRHGDDMLMARHPGGPPGHP